MWERRVANVMSQRQGLCEILVQSQHVRQGTRDLRDRNGVGKAVAEMVGQARSEHLGLGLQAAEGAGMNYAVAVALESVTVRVFGFGVSPPPASLYRKSQPRQHERATATAAIRPAARSPFVLRCRAGCVTGPVACVPQRASLAPVSEPAKSSAGPPRRRPTGSRSARAAVSRPGQYGRR